jgi:hypothetical protein
MGRLKIYLSLALLSTSSLVLAPTVYAQVWDDTPCVFGNNENYQLCKETKSEAILQGTRGWLHTFTFPNQKKFYWFYGEQSVLCQWKDTYVREDGKSYWVKVNPDCDQDGWIDFVLNDSQTRFKIGMGY